MTTDDLRRLVGAALADADTQWSLGTFGAIAEFMRDPGEPVTLGDGPRLSAVTARGGIAFDDLSGVRAFASETAVGSGWSHRVALCLPAEACAMSRHDILTELGPDSGALRDRDRGAILFDLGLGTLPCEICIRTAEPALLAILRAHAGLPLFGSGSPVMRAILDHGPHRVFLARCGRAEVFQPIPPPDGTSPEGPHTHVLPKLIASGRTHAATEPVPEGLVPVAHFCPGHPLKDAAGRPNPYDEARHAAFQGLLQRHGDPVLLTVKRRLLAAIAAGESPASFRFEADRFSRQTIRVALRQLAAAPNPPQGLAGWAALHDRPKEKGEAADDYGHGS